MAAYRRPAKVTSPRMPNLVGRPRLFERLDDLRQRHAAIYIVGAPGAGKTMLATAYVRQREIASAWYQLEATDRDPATFFHYLASSVRHLCTGRKRPLPELKPEYLGDPCRFARRFFREMFSRVPRGTILVLDDYHELPEDEPLHQLVASVLPDIPPGSNLLLLSRTAAPGSFARAIAHEQLASIDEDALPLDLGEAGAIAAVRTPSAPASEVARAHAISAGWAAGFTLLLERLRAGHGLSDVEQGESLPYLFEYFATHLLEVTFPQEEELLLTLSHLPYMPASAVRELTGSHDALAVLERLHKRNLFTTRLQAKEPTYRFHALLRSFLQDRARRLLTTAEQQSLRRQSAALLEALGDIGGAIALFGLALDLESVRRLILGSAGTLLGQGRWQQLTEWIAQFPQDALHGDCWLMYWSGRAVVATQPETARHRLVQAFGRARECADRVCEAQCASAIVETYMIEFRDFRPLDDWIAVIGAYLDQAPSFPDAQSELRVQSALLIGLAVRQPSSARLPVTVERVFALLGADIDANLRAVAAMHLLRYGATTGPIAVARRAAREVDLLLALPQVSDLTAAVGLAATTWLHALTGEREECLRAYARICGVAEEQGLPFLRKVALLNTMWLELFAHRVQPARAMLAELVTLVNPAHPFDAATLHGVRGWFALLEGDNVLAIEHATQALRFFDQAGSMMHRINFRMQLVTAHFQLGDLDQASDWCRSMREVAAGCLTAWQQCSLSMWEANIAHRRGNPTLMRAKLSEALSQARREETGFIFFNWCKPWMPELCAAALALDIESAYVRELIRMHGYAPPSAAADRWPWQVRIQTLGAFVVSRDGNQVEFGRKAPRRVLSLLKCIVAMGEQGVPAALLADALWPDQAGDAAVRALGVALARLRRLLGSPGLVQVVDERVSIDRARVWTDVRALEQAAADAEAAVASTDNVALATAANALLVLYRGAFLHADTDDAWALRPRLRLRALFLRKLGTLGAAFERQGRSDLALPIYERGLEVDDLADEFYQGVERCQVALGQPALAQAARERKTQALSTTAGPPATRHSAGSQRPSPGPAIRRPNR